MDGVIGIFSGSTLPGNLSTDNGLLRLTFTTDETIQRSGWAASYNATAAPKIPLPDCSDGARPVQAVLRTRQAASELSWTVSRRSAVLSSTEPLLGALASKLLQPPVVMTGGLLPAALDLSVPAAVKAQPGGEYKDYRSYYSYACLPVGSYDLNLFDSYGDGWDGGRLSLSVLVISNGTTGVTISECAVASDTVLKSTNTVPFDIEVGDACRGCGWQLNNTAPSLLTA